MNAKRLGWEGRERGKRERIIRSVWNYASMDKNREKKFENICIFAYNVQSHAWLYIERDIFQIFCKTFPNPLCIDADNETRVK